MSEKRAIKEIFSDYEKNGNILNAKILNINLYRKTNKLLINLETKLFIELKDLVEFEEYLKDRFNLDNVWIDLQYEEDAIVPNIEEEWENILNFLSAKYPLTKIILKNSKLDIKEKKMNIILPVKGAEFLTARGFNKILEQIFFSVYKKTYKVNFMEKLSEETVELYENRAKQAEKLAIEVAKQEAQAILEEKKEEKVIQECRKNENKIQKENKYEAKQEKNVSIQEPQEDDDDEKKPLILGRNANIKENLVKVADISVDSGKIALEGEIINTDFRELKSGKFLLMFDLYDGTSTITCKAFVAPEKIKKVISRIQEAKGIKIEGTAQFDPFAKELGVIANIIVETPGRKKIVRQDTAEEKRVELHMHTQMSQMDGMTAAKDLIKRAMKWGMKSIAITDHGVVQAFPEAHKLLRKKQPRYESYIWC